MFSLGVPLSVCHNPLGRTLTFLKAMGAVKDLIAKLRREAHHQEEAILDIVTDNEWLLVDLNAEQLMSGVDAESMKLKEYRSESYAAMKARMNPRGVTDLKLTGAFHSSMVAATDKWPVIFSASDRKTENLVSNYGEEIFGLTEKSKTILAHDYLKEDIIEYYRQLFQL